MTTDQLDETEQVEETGAQVGDGESETGNSRDTDGHTEAPAAESPETTDDAGNPASAERTDSVVTSDSTAENDGETGVEGTDGAVAEVPPQDEQQKEAQTAERFDAEGLKAVPAPEAEGEEEVDLEGGGARWLEGLFERMDLDIGAEFADQTDERVRINLTGDDADRLLGRGKMGPKALEAVETILSRVFAGHPRSNDVYLDVDGARQERTERLQRVADDLADRAVELSKNVTISGLNSSERRVIHHQLRDDDRVETESVGEGIFRRLKIEPHN